MPSFLYQDKIVCGFAGFKAHCALWFWKGKAIVGKKPSEAMGNFGRITSAEDLPSATKIKAYVRRQSRSSNKTLVGSTWCEAMVLKGCSNGQNLIGCNRPMSTRPSPPRWPTSRNALASR
jgi:hypothetical protein